MNRRFPILCFLLIVVTFCSAQSGWDKSKLLTSLQKDLADTTRINIYNELCWPIYSYSNADSSLYYGHLALQLSGSKHEMKLRSVAFRRIGITYSNLGDVKNAVVNEEESYRLSDSLHFERGKFLALNNIGVAYLNREFFSNALAYFLRTLPYLEESKDYGNHARVFVNCGIINRSLKNLEKEKYYFLNAGKYAALDGNSELQINVNSYLCASYRRLNKLDSANYFIERAGALITNDTRPDIAFNYYLTRAQLPAVQEKHKEALGYLQTAEKFASGLSDKVTLYINFGEQYEHLKAFPEALKYYQLALDLSEKNKMYDNMQYVSEKMAKIYEHQHNLPAFAHMLKRYVMYRDSNETINQKQEILAKQMQFDLERQHVADSIRYEQKETMTKMELDLAESNLSKERVMRICLIVGLLIIMAFAIFISKRLHITRRQKVIIEDQKKLVDIKNREITDSINYARRLQLAILPQISEIQSKLDFSIFYQPKDIIGGDFYFFDQFGGKIFLAICDCTGHGIPGAIMSVVCHEALSKSIREHKLQDPAQILEKTRTLIIANLNAAEKNIRDGMDCSLLVLDEELSEAAWAGAYNPLWRHDENGFVEIKGTKQSVSFHEQLKPFDCTRFKINSGSTFYLFTDGYADQFGGAKGKKYKYASLQNYLLEIQSHSVAEQVQLLETNFTKWKGALEQIDDVSVAILKF
jgi:serine phosphatase RsbU (regulator of sigma subunit)